FHARALSRHYRSADVVLANSRGVADDLVKTARLPRERVHIVPNPVVGSILYELAEQPVSHPWLASKERPVLIAGGRLAGVKDYPTLLRALALLKAEGSSVRLIVLGEGGHRARLSRLASRLGIADRTHLVGHTDNAYAYIARADGVVLSSRREGNPNVLIEAMALGTPVASTDCPSGPRELLHGGVLGPLVPVGDWRALARAMAQILADPVPRRRLQAAAQAFTVDASTDALQCALAVAGRS
ncbi:MAG: glycosyltransferase, partial [Gammaproteobacteria bacterium]|nr:glycosyltransferase [Gammaproteobacteria bacterium]